MNTAEILDILKHSIPRLYQTKVLAADKLNVVDSQQFALIANNQNSDQPGMHWIAMFKKREDNQVEFFDSCAMPLEFYEPGFESFLASKADIVRMCSTRIQSTRSNSCGQFSIYYLLHRVNGMSFESIMQTFEEFDLELNDRIVGEFTNNNFPKSHLLKAKAHAPSFGKELQLVGIIQCCQILEEFLNTLPIR